MHIQNKNQMTQEESKSFNTLLANYQKLDIDSGKSNNILFDEQILENHKKQKLIYKFSRWFEFKCLLKRSFLNSTRAPVMTKVKLMSVTLVIILIDLIFWDLGEDIQSVQDRNGVLFFICVNLIAAGMVNVMLTFPVERALFLREYSNNMYGCLTYFYGKVISEIPNHLIWPLYESFAVYFAIGLQ